MRMDLAIASTERHFSASTSNVTSGTPVASHLPLFATPLSMYESPSMGEINGDITARL